MAKHTQPHLLLHNLIGALSYWGTTVRILLIGFVMGTAVLAHVVDSGTLPTTESYALTFMYVMACLLLLDAGYVTMAKSQPLRPRILDKLVLWTALIVLSVIAVAPYFVIVTTDIFYSLSAWLMLVVLFILALRLVLGMIMTSEK